MAGELSPFAGLGALRHFDLDLIGVDEILTRHAKSPRRNLLDRRPLAIAVGQGLEPLGVFAPLAGVALGAEPVHRDRERFMGLAADRAV